MECKKHQSKIKSKSTKIRSESGNLVSTLSQLTQEGSSCSRITVVNSRARFLARRSISPALSSCKDLNGPTSNLMRAWVFSEDGVISSDLGFRVAGWWSTVDTCRYHRQSFCRAPSPSTVELGKTTGWNSKGSLKLHCCIKKCSGYVHRRSGDHPKLRSILHCRQDQRDQSQTFQRSAGAVAFKDESPVARTLLGYAGFLVMAFG